jgi:hypothetical protein
MTKIAAFTALQDAFGKEHAQVLAEFLEVQDEKKFDQLTTKDDLKDLEIRLLKEMTRSREDLLTRLQWTSFIQIITTIGALIALAKLL